MIHALRWLFYLLRLILYRCAALLRFAAKPGSRIIIPVALIALVFMARSAVHEAMTVQARQIAPGYQPETGLLDVATVIAVIAAILGYVLFSRLLGVTLGAFPVARRPLPPQHKLKPTKTEITSAAVRVVVPPLPKH